MASIGKLAKNFLLLLLPVAVLLVLALVGACYWLLKETSKPPTAQYLVTPDKYVGLSTRGAKITDESWVNKDGSSSRGWLLRGKEGSPAVILLHRYGADRSHVLNLGVKMNEVTNYTVLMPDLRGHGIDALVKTTTFGGCEADDVSGAINFLRNLKTDNSVALVAPEIGLYGVELGGFAGMTAASNEPAIKALLLDSVPLNSDDLLGAAIQKRYPFASFITSKIAQSGTYFYFQGCFNRDSLCNIAGKVKDRKVLILAGVDAPTFQRSSTELGACFSSPIEKNTELSISGFSVLNASGEQAEAYDQRVIEFFKKSLSN